MDGWGVGVCVCVWVGGWIGRFSGQEIQGSFRIDKSTHLSATAHAQHFVKVNVVPTLADGWAGRDDGVGGLEDCCWCKGGADSDLELSQRSSHLRKAQHHRPFGGLRQNFNCKP